MPARSSIRASDRTFGPCGTCRWREVLPWCGRPQSYVREMVELPARINGHDGFSIDVYGTDRAHRRTRREVPGSISANRLLPIADPRTSTGSAIADATKALALTDGDFDVSQRHTSRLMARESNAVG